MDGRTDERARRCELPMVGRFSFSNASQVLKAINDFYTSGLILKFLAGRVVYVL